MHDSSRRYPAKLRTATLAISMVFVLAYVLSACVLVAAEHALLRCHDRSRVSSGPGRDLWLDTEDGLRIYARYIERDARLPTLLYLHGGGGSVATRSDRLALFASLGANVLAVEYRGYGPSEGLSSDRGLERDAMAAYAWLRRRTAAKNIVAFGESMGGAPATWLASTQPLGGLILLSTFTTPAAWFACYLPWLPTKWLVRTHFDNLQAIAQVRAPKLLIHSRSDEVVPFTMARELWSAALAPKRHLWLDGVGHDETFYRARGEATRALREFLALPR